MCFPCEEEGDHDAREARLAAESAKRGDALTTKETYALLDEMLGEPFRVRRRRSDASRRPSTATLFIVHLSSDPPTPIF
jgi:hypothetical protein